MDVGVLHSLVRDLNFDTFGVSVTVLPGEDADPIETTGIWMTPATDGMPVSGSRTLRRKEAIKILALKSADAVGLTKDASRITAPDGPGGTVRTWRLDGPSESFSDHTRLTVVRDTSEDT